ncbi:hypothetical protein GCM10023321_16650 [Pseudonocardia eucalypti]|uniref:Uncharacterized protein n=1 Tax=Pseudonocardia eucalypti TaxID=648755 RepID=A0ABP9PQZ4_9PSEU|nr:hypothetical protein [Pseudonocardia eucalypti]
MPSTLSYRDRKVLRAVAEGRCRLSCDCGTTLVIDGVCYSDQFAGRRLTQAGLIDASARADVPARLTPTGSALLLAA